MTEATQYPWYAVVDGQELQQGDILERFPVMQPTHDPAQPSTRPLVDWDDRDVVLLTQSCDLVAGREKVREVLLGAVHLRSEVQGGQIATPKGMEEARRGNIPGVHLLAQCDIEGFERELRVVNFRDLSSLPVGFVREHARLAGPRLRLLPPYREHLAQAFARYFMRVGLPADIPPFRP